MRNSGKRFVLATAMLAGASLTQAAQIGPDAFGYTARDVAFSFTNIAATGAQTLANVDDSTVAVGIGFSFNFYGAAHNSIFVSSNGLLSFVAANATFTNQSLTGAVGVNQPTIAVLWDDWDTRNDTPSAVYTQTVGAPGSQRFIVQWDQVYPFGSNPTGNQVTFQAQLFEDSGDILLSYLDVTTGTSNSLGGSATVGIRNVSGNVNGENLQWSFNQAVIANESSILFSTQAVPEPGTVALLGLGFAGLAAWRRRRLS